MPQPREKEREFMRRFLSLIAAAALFASVLFAVPASAATVSSLTLDFDDNVSQFTAASRVTCTAADGVQVITAADNAGNGYSLAYYDFSAIASDASKVIVEFDSKISSNTRYLISLYDTALRGTNAAGSDKSTYNLTGLIYTMGLDNNSNYYKVMGTNVNSALDSFIHTKVTVDFTSNTMDYTVTSADGATTIASKQSSAFYATANQCTGIEFYSWANNSVAYLDNLSITAYKVDTSTALTDTEITADKTAQWTYQEANPTGYSAYDLKIHGWIEWECAAYMGFTLPGNFAPDKLSSATLVLTTTLADKSGEAYIYAADYSAFENNKQYEGTDGAPSYNTTEFKSFTSPEATTTSIETDIDITEYIASLSSTSTNIAFRIDVKSLNTSNNWRIGSCNNGGPAPVLRLEYDTSVIPTISTDAADWTTTGSGVTVSGGVISAASGASGEARQTLSGVADGTYDLTATVTATVPGENDAAYLFAKAKGHTMARTAIPLCSSETIIVPNVTVDSGTLEVGLYANGTQTITVSDLALSKTKDTRVQFLKGGEISKLTYLEEKGPLKYKTSSGGEKDCLQIMAEQGFNLARIRILNDPGPGHGQDGYYLPAGYEDETDCLKLAKRAKEKGMQIEWTFAYSDYWVDGEKQMIPYAWQQEINSNNYTGDSLVTYLEGKVYAYTTDIMEKLIAQDTCPEYVSIGNEIQVGILFNDYKNSNYYTNIYCNADNIAKLLNAGAKAVRETASKAGKTVKIVLHSDNGGKVSARTIFTSILSKVDYDVIGASFYPYYNSDVSIDDVVNEFNTFVNTYNKDVIIMETGYNWSAVRGDNYEGQLKDNGYYQSSYGESKAGQKAFLTELYAKLKKVLGGRCIGDLYWDPIMAYDGSSWQTGKGYNTGWAIKDDGTTDVNQVSNSDLFDFSVQALPAFDAMKYNTDANDKVLITGTVKSNGKAAASAEITLTVNGESCTTTTDAYGEYIVAVDYPYLEKFRITCGGYSSVYYKDAPQEGVLLSGIDFSAAGTASYTAPVYNNDLKIAARYVNAANAAEQATLFTFSVIPKDGISKLTITRSGKTDSAIMENYKNSWVTGEGSVQLGLLCEGDYTDVSAFTVEVK